MYTGGSLCFSKVQVSLFAACGLKGNVRMGNFNLSALNLCSCSELTAADQQEIHLLCLCARVRQTAVQRCAGKSQQVPNRHIFRTWADDTKNSKISVTDFFVEKLNPNDLKCYEYNMPVN